MNLAETEEKNIPEQRNMLHVYAMATSINIGKYILYIHKSCPCVFHQKTFLSQLLIFSVKFL